MLEAPLAPQLAEAALVDAVELVEADQVVAPGPHHLADPVQAATAAVEDVPMQQLQRPAVGTAAGRGSAGWQGGGCCSGRCVERAGLGRVGRARRLSRGRARWQRWKAVQRWRRGR